MAPIVERLPIPPTMLGEGPHWDAERCALYFVDYYKYIYKYTPTTKELTKANIVPEPCALPVCPLVIPVAGSMDLFLANQGHKVQIIRWDGQNDSKVELVKVLAELDQEHPKNALNDAKVDSRNRLYTGTVGVDSSPEAGKLFKCVPTGSFYSVTADGVVDTYDTGVTASNGIVIDERRRALYHIDTFPNLLRRFDYDVDTGHLSNKTILFEHKPSTTAYLDGMTMDTDGNLWVACFGGGCCIKINPDTGKVIQTVEIPDKNVTSLTFGGNNLDVLFVTSGHINPDGDKTIGGTYAVYGLGVKGCRNIPFDIKI